MSIELKVDEEQLRSEIADRVAQARRAFAESRLGEDVQKAILEAGERAHRLHTLLKARNLEPKHHAYMIRNRELQPDHPEFYMHFHPLEDLLKFIEDPHANDDPVDRTIGAEFEFKVYSRRWGHEDTYHIKRTDDGWEVHHASIGGSCDKGGRPFLFQNLDQDLIEYPARLDERMEWLWDRAGKEGLSKDAVQHVLKQLADWISVVEKNTPAGGVWEAY